MKRMCLLITVFIIFLVGAFSFAGGARTLMPSRSGGGDSQRNTSNPASHYFGVDGQGNTSVLTPNHSGGYVGFDGQGNAVIITPLRGNSGVDSNGNIWTIRSR